MPSRRGSRATPESRRCRPSPSDSATLHPVGKRKLGNDGDYWTVAVNKRDVKRWVKASKRASKQKTYSERKFPLGATPSFPAAFFPPGFSMKGGDGNVWTVKLTTNNARRWTRAARAR